jgi:hypothetical protein
LNKSRQSRETAEAGFARAQSKAKDAKAAVSEHETQARAMDDKTARLRAQRLARDAAAPVRVSEQFKTAPRRRSQPAKKVALSDDVKRLYEEQVQERDERQRKYGAHLPADRK